MAKRKKTIKKPVWLKYTEEEVKEIILKIVEKNPEITAEKIGLILRDNYGIPSTRIYGFKIGQVLKEAGKYHNPDIKNLKIKNEKIEKHIAKNKGDKVAGRALIITKSKLKKAEDYFK
ncbi:MAG: 30S ribosomal protein S15 [Candidatus Pacearchaeota archaeon]